MNSTHIGKVCGAAVLLELLSVMPLAASPVTFQVGGTSSPASIIATVNAFQAALGSPNNGNAPGTTDGRREINWDGGGANSNALSGTPFNGFLDTRGAQFTTPGTGFIQAPPSGGTQDGLAGFFGNATYATTFSAFSPLRVFTPIGSNVTDISFFIPGTNGSVGATVDGFGAVFSNVQLANSAIISFFDQSGILLSEQFVPTGIGSASLSFLGVVFDAGEDIGRVRITSGTNPLSSGTNNNPAFGINLVVLDDFFYSEPVAGAVPEPTTWVMMILGFAGVGFMAYHRSRKDIAIASV